jgi:hypothetical protein
MSIIDRLRVVHQELGARREALQAKGMLEILILYVTTHCNMRCGHCFFADNLNDGTQDLSPERVERIFKTLPPIREEIAITGGEPFLHRRLPQVLRAVHDSPSSRDIQINTNGFYGDRTLEYCRDITSWNRKRISIQISLDGLEETHDAIRGIPGSFRKAMDTAERLMSLQHLSEPGFFTPVFLMIINRMNYREIRPLSEMIRREFGICLGLELVRGSNFSAWRIPEHLREGGFNPPGIGLPPEGDWDSIYSEVRALNREMGFPFRHFAAKMKVQFEMLRNQKPVVSCVASNGLTPVIYSNGDVATCEFSRPFANLGDFQDDFLALWESPQSRANQVALRHCFCTHACFLVPSMRRDLTRNLRLLTDL